MNTTGLSIIVVLLGICVGLAGTNPTTQEYGAFLETSLSKALEKMDHTETSRQREIIQDLLKTQGKKVIDLLVHSKTVRRNYGLFSVFETRVFEVRVLVVGVGPIFIPVDDVEVITRKLGQLMLSSLLIFSLPARLTC